MFHDDTCRRTANLQAQPTVIRGMNSTTDHDQKRKSIKKTCISLPGRLKCKKKSQANLLGRTAMAMARTRAIDQLAGSRT